MKRAKIAKLNARESGCHEPTLLQLSCKIGLKPRPSGEVGFRVFFIGRGKFLAICGPKLVRVGFGGRSDAATTAGTIFCCSTNSFTTTSIDPIASDLDELALTRFREVLN
jgi:hypothetical protein